MNFKPVFSPDGKTVKKSLLKTGGKLFIWWKKQGALRMLHAVRMAEIALRHSYVLIPQAKNATSSIFPCLSCNSHSESRTIQVNNKIVRQITIKLNNRYFCGIPRLPCWFSTGKRLLLWCWCIGEPHFDLSSGGAFLCLSPAERLRQTVSSTRQHSTVNIWPDYVGIFLK